MKKYGILVIGLLMLVSFLAPVAHAAEYGTFFTEANGDFIVSPTKTTITVAPGETITRQITVRSRIDGQQNFRVTAKDFVASDNPDEVVRFLENSDRTSPYSLSDNISVELNEFSLGLGETVTFDVVVSAPAEAAPGGRYGAIVITALPDEAAIRRGAGVAFYTEVGSLLLVRIDGAVDEYGYVDQFTVNGETDGGVFFKKPLNFEVLFRNEGNVHLIPSGQITINNMFGNPVDAIGIDAYFALPDSVRYRSFLWPGKDQNFFLIGRYTAELEMYLESRDVPEVHTVTFWYIPIWAILIFLGVVLAVSFLHTYFKRNFTRRKKED